MNDEDDEDFGRLRQSSVPSASRKIIPTSPLPPQPTVDQKKLEEKKREEKMDLYAKKFINYQKEEDDYLELKRQLIEKEQLIWEQNKEKILEEVHEKAVHFIETQNYEKAIPLLEKSSKAGNSKSLYELGRIYEV